MNVERLRRNLESIRERLAGAARRSGREPGSVGLVAVTKRSPAEWIEPLLRMGVADFGENYPQELVRKWETTRALVPPPRWHLIGHLQTNKVKKVVGPLGSSLVLIHSVDSVRLLAEIGRVAAAAGLAPRVCLQVNTSHEPSKHGWSEELILAESEQIAAFRGVEVAGLMTMAALGTTAETARDSFIRLRTLRDQLRVRTGLALDELSMGMSNDFETAVEEGATLVRIGSSLFEGVDW